MTEQDHKDAADMDDAIHYWLDLIEDMEYALDKLKEASKLVLDSKSDGNMAQAREVFERANAIKQDADDELADIVGKISIYDKNILSRALAR